MAGPKVGLGPKPGVSPNRQSVKVIEAQVVGSSLPKVPREPIIVSPKLMRHMKIGGEMEAEWATRHQAQSIFSDSVSDSFTNGMDRVQFQIELVESLSSLGPVKVAEELARELGPFSEMPIFDFVLKMLTPDGGEVEVKPDQMSLMGKKSREKKARKAAGGGASEPSKYRKILSGGDYVTITPEGIILNNGKPEPFFEFVAGKYRIVKADAKSSELNRKFLKMFDLVKENGSYREYVLTLLVAAVADSSAEEEFTGVAIEDMTYEWITAFAERHMTRLYGDLSYIPTDQGIWSELYLLWSRYKEGERGTLVRQLGFAIQAYVKELGDELVLSDASVRFGPIVITAEEFQILFAESINYELQMLERRTALSKRERELRERFLPVNRAGRAWLQRDDIPNEVKQRLAMTYYLGSDDEVIDLFGDSERYEAMPDETQGIVSELYQKHVLRRFDSGSGDVSVSDGDRQIEVSFTRYEHLLGLWVAWKKQSDGAPDPNISYTLFRDLRRHVEYYLSFRNRTSMVAEIDRAKEESGLRRYWQTSELYLDFVDDETVDYDVRVMVFDLFLQVGRFDLDVYYDVAQIIRSDQEDSLKLKHSIRKIYEKHISYARELRAYVRSERESSESPVEIAKKTIKTVITDSGDLGRAWKSIFRRVHSSKEEEVIEGFNRSLVAVENDIEFFHAWIYGLASALDNSDFREQLRRYDLDSDPSGIKFQRLLQDAAYPHDQSFDIERSNDGIVRRSLEVGEWKDFVSATAFLLPSEFELFAYGIGEIQSDAVKAVRSYDRRSIPEFLKQRFEVFRNGNLSKAVRGVTAVLRGEYGRDSALSLREILRTSIDNRDIEGFYTILQLGSFVAEQSGEYRNLLEHVLTEARRYIDLEVVQGDVLGIITRRYLEGEGGAHAELVTLDRYIEEGKSVRILSPDPSGRRKTPDFIVSGDRNPEIVEIKSRRWNGTDSFQDVVRSLLSASEQISAYANRIAYERVNGRIVLYIDRYDNPSNCESLLQQLKSKIVERLESFSSINMIDIYFVRSSHKSWIVDSEHHFEFRQ